MANVKGRKSYEKKRLQMITSKFLEKKKLTKKRLDFGCTSRKIRENAVASPIQRMSNPNTRRTRADRGVKLPKALALRKRGNASCSIARKQYSFCEWNISGMCANMFSSLCVVGSCVLLNGNECIRSAGGR